MPTEPAQSTTKRWWHLADRLGAAAAFLCAIHCALLPFVLALLPLVGLEFLGTHAFERNFVLFACVLATATLVVGYRRHRRPLPLSLALPGLVLLLVGVIFAQHYSIVLHSVMVTCGGLLLASAHFVNLRLDRHAGHLHGPGEHCPNVVR
jgi:hypothetical protein